MPAPWRRISAGRAVNVGRAVLVAVLLLTVAFQAFGLALPVVRAQTVGATLTVLKGRVGVLKADGSPVSPATSGLALGVGDQVATIGPASALVTFFEGSEVELGADTTIVLDDLGQSGTRTTISIVSVLGTTLHRVVPLTDASSTYRVESGGTVALVRGTVFAHHADGSGDVTVAVGEGEVEYPGPNAPVRRGQKRTVTSRGDVVDGRFGAGTSLFNVVTEPASSGNPSGTDNPGIGTGSFTAPQQQSLQPQPQDNSRNQVQSSVGSTPGRTFLILAAPSGSTRLEVESIDGFAVGDVIRIGSGPGSELGTIVGFGSIVLQQPTTGSYPAGTSIELVGGATSTPTATATGSPTATTTATATSTPSPTPTSTVTLEPIGTFVTPPTATFTPTATSTPSATPTPSPTATATATATGTATLTATPLPTATHSPTATATATLTPTATSTPSPTPTDTPIPTATATPSPTATTTPTATPSPTATATPSSTATPTYPCLGPLSRELATQGGGQAGATSAAVTNGFRLTAYVVLVDAAPNTEFDVYIDVNGGTAGTHQFIGTFASDGSGGGSFAGSAFSGTLGEQVDVEVILRAQDPTLHQYIRELFAPCAE